MTNEKIELVVKDLCARLPYGVICNSSAGNYKLLGIDGYDIHLDSPVYDDGDGYFDFMYEKVIPFLRPMSSMTEEEAKDYFKNSEYESSECYEAGANCEPVTVKAACSADEACVNTDWLNAHHFDYRGLIEKGWALKAPDGMYEK